jgi:type VI secretion system protein ImpF
MPESVTPDRLLPCLLDRLMDDEPDKTQESRDRRVVSLRRYRQSVLADLEALLNAHSHGPEDELNELAHVRVSVVNFGIPDFGGLTATDISIREMERGMHQAILAFEPRVIASTLTVKVAAQTSEIAMVFEISGSLWAQPMPEQLYVRTEIDLETGQCQIKEGANG